MGRGARGRPLAVGLWLFGLLLLASVGGGVGAFLLGAWATAGLAATFGPGTGHGSEVLVGMALGLGMVGLLALWASAPSSFLAGASGYLGLVFWGALVGGVAGSLWNPR